jgi:hypothetical protein
MLNTDEQQELNRLRDKYKVSSSFSLTSDGSLHRLSTVTTMIPPLTDGLTCCASTGWPWRSRHPRLAGRRYGQSLASFSSFTAERWPLTAQLPAGAAKQAVCAADDKLAHVHLCHSCQGSGVHADVYEFRRLEVSQSPLTRPCVQAPSAMGPEAVLQASRRTASRRQQLHMCCGNQ